MSSQYMKSHSNIGMDHYADETYHTFKGSNIDGLKRQWRCPTMQAESTSNQQTSLEAILVCISGVDRMRMRLRLRGLEDAVTICLWIL